ncbi:Putative inactive serine/threonine-protein kinase bub1 [Picochlorum sp. SENEW3]|nr:Putative inactive serine/threonine-protein kinase bub1 [Picochlorum sp. SENEW3]
MANALPGEDGCVGVTNTCDWEECKENFQPIKDGRKPEGLSNIGSKGSKGVLQPKGVEEDRRKFIQAIKDYEGEDPLETWLEYIKWTKDTFVSGGQKSELLPLLERCTREFHGREEYRDDIRYLRVWIQYADCLPDPADVFSYLVDHNIGQGHALFYIAYATFLELKRNYSLADSMYQAGIEKKAVPLERLEQKFLEFQHRMVRRIQRKASEQQQRGQPAPGERRGLKTLRASSHKSTGGKRRNTASSNAGSSAIPVFVDEEFSSSSAQRPAPTGSMVLPSYQESQKENTLSAMPWAGQTIRQKDGSGSTQREEPLQVMEDPHFARSRVEGDSNAQKNEHTLRQRLDKDVLEEQLSVDPLKLLKNPSEAQEHQVGSFADRVTGDVLSPFEHQTVENEVGKKEEEEDVTIGTRDAYKAMNCLFTGAARSSSLHREASEPLELEPTMTINTRDALDAVNNMFQDSFNVSGEGRQAIPDDVQGRDETIIISNPEQREGDGGFDIREDTVFLSDGKTLGDENESQEFLVREDTVFTSGNGGEDENFSIREDTVFLRGDTSQSRGHVEQGEPDETVQLQGSDSAGVPSVSQLSENDENAVPEGLVQIPNRERKHDPLRSLDRDDLLANGIEEHTDEEAEEALATAISAEEEGFVVLEDSNPQQKLIDPFDGTFQKSMIESLDPAVSEWPGVHVLNAEQADEYKRLLDPAAAADTVCCPLVVESELDVTITGKIGSGSYANVYGGIDNSEKAHVALKLQSPPCPWEWFLCKVLEGRVGHHDVCKLVIPSKMLLSEEFSLIVMPKGEQGTLQDLLNRFLHDGKHVDQSIAASMSLCLFEAVKQLHDNKIVHNDIKPDNIMFAIDSAGEHMSFSLIDIGRGVDLQLLPENTLLFGDSETDSFRCVEMRESKPWLWQADTYAMACVLHCIIFGKYMEVERVIDQQTGETFVRSSMRFPRAYDEQVWESIFRDLLNCQSLRADVPPDWDSLCEKMSSILSANGKAHHSEMKRLARMFHHS